MAHSQKQTWGLSMPSKTLEGLVRFLLYDFRSRPAAGRARPRAGRGGVADAVCNARVSSGPRPGANKLCDYGHVESAVRDPPWVRRDRDMLF